MTAEDKELAAVSYLVRADRRFRTVLYFVTAVIAALFLFAAFRLITLQDQFEQQRADIVKTAAELGRDARTRDEEERRYITCLLLVPIEERTLKVQADCFRFADLPGGLDERNFTPIDPAAVGS